jgi:hypothetical protein
MTQETSKKNIKATNKSLQADIKSEGSGSFHFFEFFHDFNASQRSHSHFQGLIS